MRKIKYRWDGEKFEEITSNFKLHYCFDTKEEAIYSSLRNKKYTLHEKIWDVEKYLETIKSTQNTMIELGIQEDMDNILLKELIDKITKDLEK